jgi:hypothetical protein
MALLSAVNREIIEIGAGNAGADLRRRMWGRRGR